MLVEITPILWNPALEAPLGGSCTSQTTGNGISLSEWARRRPIYGVIPNKGGNSGRQRPKPQTSDSILPDLQVIKFSLGAGKDPSSHEGTHPTPQ